MAARRPKGTGGIERVGDKHRARKVILGKVYVGRLRSSRKEADDDRHALGRPHLEYPDSPTLSEYADALFEGRFKDGPRAWKPNTWNTNETLFRIHVSDKPIAQMPLGEITRREVQELIDSTNLAPASVLRLWNVVTKIFSEAERDALSDGKACRKIALPRRTGKHRALLPDTLVKSLRRPATRLECMLLTAVDTGLRRSEVCNLKWKDVGEWGVRVSDAKTPAGWRTMPLTMAARAAIEAQPKRGAYVFSTESGKRIDPHNFTRDFRVWAEANGLPRMLRLHDLRATCASRMLRQGVDLRTVMDLLGWADTRTALGIYARSRQEDRDAAVAKLEAG